MGLLLIFYKNFVIIIIENEKEKRYGIMIELKGIDRLNKVVNDFTAQFGVTAELGPEFQAFCDNNHINFAINYDEEDAEYFIKDAEKRYPEIEADIFIWALLHEIGHCRTEHLWSAEEAEYFEYQKKQLACNTLNGRVSNEFHSNQEGWIYL